MKSLAQLVLMEDLMQTTLQQPKPRPPKRRSASFSRTFLISPIRILLFSLSTPLFRLARLLDQTAKHDPGQDSNSHLRRSEADPIPRKPTRSMPEMCDNNWFLMSLKPGASVVMPDAESIAPSGSLNYLSKGLSFREASSFRESSFRESC
jgi:hypothetical protein